MFRCIFLFCFPFWKVFFVCSFFSSHFIFIWWSTRYTVPCAIRCSNIKLLFSVISSIYWTVTVGDASHKLSFIFRGEQWLHLFILSHVLTWFRFVIYELFIFFFFSFSIISNHLKSFYFFLRIVYFFFFFAVVAWFFSR